VAWYRLSTFIDEFVQVAFSKRNQLRLAFKKGIITILGDAYLIQRQANEPIRRHANA